MRKGKQKVKIYLDSIWHNKLSRLKKRYLHKTILETDHFTNYSRRQFLKKGIQSFELFKTVVSQSEEDNFIRQSYIERADEAILAANILLQEYSDSSNRIKNLKRREILLQIHPLPSVADREVFINEFIDYLHYISDTYPGIKSYLEVHPEALSSNFYHCKRTDTKLEFQTISREYNSFYAHYTLNKKLFSPKAIRKVITIFLRKIGLENKIHVKIKPQYLFSVHPVTLRLAIPLEKKISEARLTQIIVHEVMGHITRGINGKYITNAHKEGLYLLRQGLWKKLYVEEGLASYLEQNIFYDSNKYDISSLFDFYIRLIAVHIGLIDEPDVVEEKMLVLCTICSLFKRKSFSFAQKKNQILISRLYKGYDKPYQKGCIQPKLAQYLYGNRKIWEFLEQGNKLQTLFTGKIGFDDIRDLQRLGFVEQSTFEYQKRTIIKYISESIDVVKSAQK